MKQIKRLKILILALILGLTMSSCSEKSEPTPPDSPTGPTRTIIAYIVATNSLSGADESDLAQMRKAVINGALGDGGNLLVYQAAYNSDPELFKITADGTTHTLKFYDSGVNSVDPDFMAQVIKDAMEKAPADDYGLVLWSHSSGWRGLDSQATSSAIAGSDGPQLTFGDDNGSVMTIPQLGEALAQVPRLAFIYFDSCFMGNVESVYQLRDVADYIVASPAETPYDGSPYDVSLAPLYKTLPEGLKECAQIAYDTYNAMTSLADRSLTISVYNMAAADRLAAAAAEVLSTTTPLSSVSSLQQYGFAVRWAPFNNFFFDMQDYLSTRGGSEEAQAELTASLEEFVYAHYATEMMWGLFPYTRVCGLSTFPYEELTTTGDRYGYTDLDWYKVVYQQ